MSRMILTDRSVAALPISNKVREYADGDTVGLALRVYPNGRKRFYFRRCIKGKESKFVLGEYPVISTNEARDLVAGVLRAHAQGLPLTQYLAKHQTKRLTFGELFDKYLTQHIQLHSSQKLAKETEQSLDRYFTRFVDVPVHEITTNDVTVFMNEMAEQRGKPTANRQFVIVKACITWGMNQGLVDLKRNPCKGVRSFSYANMSRERYLKPLEIQTLLTALDTERNQDHADIIRLLLFTGQRKSNVMQMEWSEIDMEAGIWTVPAHKAKARKSIVVALTSNAMRIIERRERIARFVFPGRSSTGCILNISDTWYSARTRAGLGSDVVLHTCRHSVGSMLGQSGASAFIIQRALGHASTRMSEKYTHLDTDSVREAQEVAQAKMLGDMADRGPNVISIKRQTAPPAAVVQDAPLRPPAKNAERIMSIREQIIIKGKILASISGGKATVSNFHKCLPGSMQCNARELARVLESMQAEGLVRKYFDSAGRVTKYALCEEELRVAILPVVAAQDEPTEVLVEEEYACK